MFFDEFFKLCITKFQIVLLFTIIVQLNCKKVFIYFMQIVLLCGDVHDSFNFRFLAVCGIFTILLLVVSRGMSRQTSLIRGSECCLFKCIIAYLYSQNCFRLRWQQEDTCCTFYEEKTWLRRDVIYNIDKIIVMDCVRFAEKTQTILGIKVTIISKSESMAFPVCSENLRASTSLKRQRQWSSSDRIAYGKVLLSFLMNNLEVNHQFVNHLAALLKKQERQVSIFHRKMLSQHRTPAFIVTHVLKHNMEKSSHQTLVKLHVLPSLNFMALNKNFDQQEQQQNGREKDFLRIMMFVQDSLEQFQESLCENGEVEDLDDFHFLKQERTRDSYDFDQNNEQGAQEDEDSTIDCVSR